MLLRNIFTRIIESDNGGAGTLLWLNLTWYPALILMYSAGISAIASDKYDALEIILQTSVNAEPNYSKERQPLVVPVVEKVNELNEAFKMIPEYKQKFVPRSEYMYKQLQPTLEDILFLGRSYETSFDTFEVLMALVYADMSGSGWAPAGRFGWKQSRMHSNAPYTVLTKDIEKQKENWAPLQAGLFGGSLERLEKIVADYRDRLSKMTFF